MRKRISCQLIILFVFICAAISSCHQRMVKEIVFTDDGAWCWFQDPRAIYVKGDKERTYAQWMTKNGQLQVGAYDHSNGKVETYTLKENWDIDDHNVGAFLLLPDKRIMVFYARHNKQGIFCKTSSHPEDITSWGEEITISHSNRITYAHPVYLNKEQTYYVFWRGPSWKPTFATSTDGITWREEKILLQDTAKASEGVRPYTKITSDGRSSIHFVFTDGHPNVETQNSVYYMKYEKGQFFKADGSLKGNIESLPIQLTGSDVVYDGKMTNIRAWIWDIALDKQGYPVIAYTLLPKPTDHRYMYARWNGEKWMSTELTPGGKWFPQTPDGVEEREQQYSGGIAIHPTNPSIAYLSREIDGIFKIEKWNTPNKGKTWYSNVITKESEHLNVRPIVPRGYDGNEDYVLWMYGEYKHYKNYNTGIKLLDFNQ